MLCADAGRGEGGGGWGGDRLKPSGCMVAVPAGSVRVITRPLAPANHRGHGFASPSPIPTGIAAKVSPSTGSPMYIGGATRTPGPPSVVTAAGSSVGLPSSPHACVVSAAATSRSRTTARQGWQSAGKRMAVVRSGQRGPCRATSVAPQRTGPGPRGDGGESDNGPNRSMPVFAPASERGKTKAHSTDVVRRLGGGKSRVARRGYA